MHINNVQSSYIICVDIINLIIYIINGLNIFINLFYDCGVGSGHGFSFGE